MDLGSAVQARLEKELQAASLRQDTAHHHQAKEVVPQSPAVPQLNGQQVYCARQRRASIPDRSEVLAANARVEALEKQVSALHNEKAILETRCYILEAQVTAEKEHSKSISIRIEHLTTDHTVALADANAKVAVTNSRLEGSITKAEQLEHLLKTEKTRTRELIDQLNCLTKPATAEKGTQTEAIDPLPQSTPTQQTPTTIKTDQQIQTIETNEQHNATITHLNRELDFYKTLHEQTMAVFKPGMKVHISGLHRSQEFNGRQACVERPLHEGRERGRILVSIDGQKVALKPTNITPVARVSPGGGGGGIDTNGNNSSHKTTDSLAVGSLVQKSSSTKVGIITSVEDQSSCTVVFDSSDTTHPQLSQEQVSLIDTNTPLFISGLQTCMQLNNTPSIYRGILQDRVLVVPWEGGVPRAINPCKLNLMPHGGSLLIKYMRIASKAAMRLAANKLIGSCYSHLANAVKLKYIRLRPLGIRKSGKWSFCALQVTDPRGRIPAGIAASCNVTAVGNMVHSGWSATTLGDRSWVRLLLPCGRRRDVSIRLSHFVAKTASESARLFAASRDTIPSEIIIESSFDGINYDLITTVSVSATNASDLSLL
eukprot:TRINITY_DN34193_c0_g1_i1.p1 TRINITY_DN34193_c0_g1~~TRINITY_DN34193_c0_g1_i1.p1  ORF type:complete len:599 (+),score=89.88 TRINITY_DN34193_c0_g1_i1:43-1839(+)